MILGDSMDGALRWAAVSVGSRSPYAVADRLAVLDHPSGGFALVVADGAGGIVGGTRAAERSVGRARAFMDGAAAPPDVSAWCAFVGDLDLSLADDPECGEAAVLALSVRGDRVYGARAGDVGAWSLAGAAATSLPRGTRGGDRAGSHRAVPEVIDAPWGDTLVVATDGWWRAADVTRALADIEELPLDAAAERLLAAATRADGTHDDDVTVVLVRRAG